MADIQALEEQTLPFYDRKRYYPVKIGRIFNDRYRTIARIGYGAYSTVWLAWDLRVNAYASLKVCIRAAHSQSFLRIDTPAGSHYCIVSKPQGNSARVLQEVFPDENVPKILNVLMEIEDDTSLKDIEKRETENPSISVDRWMSDLYRAAEVFLQLPWGYPVDIWSVGIMILELMEGKNFLNPLDRVHNHFVLPLALAQYIGYLGPPPPEIICQSPLFDFWISEPPMPKTSLEEIVTTIPRGEEKDQFLRFIRNILTWHREARLTSNEVILDEWLTRHVPWWHAF
ncbi:kinase-like domain-containing protein [Aspergillus aurantiobrunneus]